MSNDLLELYPQYKNRSALHLQRYNIVPIDVTSQHSGKQVKFTEHAANRVVEQLVNTPLTIVDGTELPEKHTDAQGNRIVIGNAIGGGIHTTEDGVKWAYGDFVIYSDVCKDSYNKLMEHKDDVGCSLEAFPIIDGEATVQDVTDYTGTAIIKRGYQAWDTELLVADKGESVKPTPVTITYDDLMKQIVGDDYNTKVSKLMEELKECKKEVIDLADRLAIKEAMTKELADANAKLRNLS